MATLSDARTLLFVPADRPERFAKAATSGADLVCVDLEDAVPPARRETARASLMDYLADPAEAPRFGLRMNSLGCEDGLRDLMALRVVRPAFVMLAKAESADAMRLLATHLPGVPLLALIESARGLAQAGSIADAHPQVQALMIGAADLAADLGCEFDWEPLLHARCAVVSAAAQAGIGSFDVPWLDLQHPEGARNEAARAAALGFSGKALIHPAQVRPVHEGFQPSSESLAKARRIVLAAQADATGAAVLDGRLIDRPIVLAAQRLLQRADRQDKGLRA